MLVSNLTCECTCNCRSPRDISLSHSLSPAMHLPRCPNSTKSGVRFSVHNSTCHVHILYRLQIVFCNVQKNFLMCVFQLCLWRLHITYEISLCVCVCVCMYMHVSGRGKECKETKKGYECMSMLCAPFYSFCIP